jgi:hypothetical protein
MDPHFLIFGIARDQLFRPRHRPVHLSLEQFEHGKQHLHTREGRKPPLCLFEQPTGLGVGPDTEQRDDQVST